MKLSVIMPVFNEKNTLKEIIKRVNKIEIDKEIIIVDDGSTDGSTDILRNINEDNIKVIFHERNKGKGAAIRTALEHINGDMIVIQDADLEYPPEQYTDLMKPILEGNADVVYGTRFIGVHRVFLFWHYMGNKFLTFITNLLYNTMLTDMETCYKVFTKKALAGIQIKSNGFDVEPELTAKIFKKKYLRVVEVPCVYYGRDYSEGKKITWKDSIPAILALIKYRFVN
ncbi:MAG: glycosyltransferase family 2 protein [Candidatus Hodarchaeota archaeon]